jgi:hypothetical protein
MTRAPAGIETFNPTCSIRPSRISTVPPSIGADDTGMTVPPWIATTCPGARAAKSATNAAAHPLARILHDTLAIALIGRPPR